MPPMPDDPARRPAPRCPVSRRPAAEATPPFCSARCAQVDLGRWLAGGYAIPGEAAEDLDALPRLERDLFAVRGVAPDLKARRNPPSVELGEILLALREVMRRADLFTHHRIEKESLSMRERMSNVLQRVTSGRFTAFPELFSLTEGRMGVVITFMAVLELIKGGMIELVQAEPFGLIHVKARVAA